MRVDIQQLLAAGNGALPFEFKLPLAGVADLAAGEALVKGAVRNHGGYLELGANTLVNATAVCGRCGEGFAYTQSFDTARPVAKALADNDSMENDEYILCDEDGFVDLSLVFGEELLLELPSRFLCDEGCKGLCPKCGANLNRKACGCTHKEIDPRLEVLKALLENG